MVSLRLSNLKENVSIYQHATVVGFLMQEGSIETDDMTQVSAFHRLFCYEVILVDSFDGRQSSEIVSHFPVLARITIERIQK